jgi:hypothetical protein
LLKFCDIGIDRGHRRRQGPCAILESPDLCFDAVELPVGAAGGRQCFGRSAPLGRAFLRDPKALGDIVPLGAFCGQSRLQAGNRIIGPPFRE